MNYANFLASWQGTQLENRFHRITSLLLAAALVVVGALLWHVERTVVLVPPVLEGEVTIAREYASQEVEEAWAMHVALLLGNVTPESADRLFEIISPLLESTLRRDLQRDMLDQVEEIRREKVAMRFTPRQVAYDTATGHAYVTGEHITEGPGAKPVRVERTYEVAVEFRNYRPLITYLDAYPGGPKLPSDKERT